MESSSKVTVTYWDPSSLFPFIEPDLRGHLPLRNLHWKSPTRPLRSISTLHVELVPYTGNGGPPIPGSTTDGRRASLTPSVSSGITPGPLTRPTTAGGKRRRHQIPGLRNTPYLKLYILRCDDNDTYKSTSRKLLREWVSTHGTATASSSSGSASAVGSGGSSISLAPPAVGAGGGTTKGDGVGKHQHDASEWLIIHVILPGTAAYAQPRAMFHPPGGQSATRGWAGMKGTTSLLEKIRSDFNTSSKSGTKDRVIQLRIHPNHPDLSLLSPPVPVSPYTLWSSPPEPKDEAEAAYQDLITKFKTQILSSFDQRVAQYEDDVNERDSQRMLPGWNFCTFFVLKEGLARAFESVGLVEDSLILYDELAVGLQDFLREEEGSGAKGALGIEDWTEETRKWVYKAQERLRRKLRLVQRRKTEGGQGGLGIGIGGEDDESTASTVVGDATDVGDSTTAASEKRDGEVEGSTTAHGSESEINDVEDEESPEPSLHDHGPPLSPYKKPYRELILANRISIFDFECYLFARQSNLLLRLGGTTTSIATPTLPSATGYHWTTFTASSPAAGEHPLNLQPGEEDLKHLTALLRRGLAFVTNVGRILRQDLYKGWRTANPTPNPENMDRDEEEEKERVIGNLIDDIVKNWMFAVCMQLLEQTEARGIPREVLWGVSSTLNTPQTAGLFPRRISSLPSTPVVEQSGFHHRPSSIMVGSQQQQQQQQAQQQGNPPLEELCAARGDILVLARSLVEGFARRKGWMGEWGSEGKMKGIRIRKKGWFEPVKTPGLEEIPLDEREEDGQKDDKDEEKEFNEGNLEGLEVGCGIGDKHLRKAVDSEMGFYELFEELSEKARRHFTLGKKIKSGERVIADLAALKFHLQDYRMAAHYLEKLTGFYADGGWDLIETSLLTMYAKCLKKMNRKEDYVRILLKLLAKAASMKTRWDWRRIATLANITPHTPLVDEFRPRDWLRLQDDEDAPEHEGDNEGLDVRGYVAEIISMSDKLSQHITVPMSQFFTDILVEPYPRHLEAQRDGYKVLVKFRYLLEESMVVQAVKVRVVSMAGGPSSREIWMVSTPSSDNGGITICKGTQRIWLETNHNIPGTYMVDQIVINTYSISFIHEILVKTTPATPVALTASNAAAAISAAKRSRLQFWPHPEALSVDLRLPGTVHLDRGRKFELVVSTGWNQILNAEISVKSATAGLRMMMREVELLTRAHSRGVALEGGKVKLEHLPPRTELVLRIPYSAERELGEISVRVELAYSTPTGDWVYAVSQTVTVALPLAVNVQDVFKRDTLFSKFQVSTALDIPLVILGARLDGAGTAFVTESSSGGDGAGVMVGKEGWLVVPRQAGQFVYRIRRRKVTGGGLSGKKSGALQLYISYRSLDEEVYLSVSKALCRDLEEAGLAEYTHLVLSHVRSRLESGSVEELEMAGVVKEVGLGLFEEFGWGDVLEGVSSRTGERQKLAGWLREWWKPSSRGGEDAEEEGEEEEKIIPLGFGSKGGVEDAGVTRSLVIPVEVPSVDVVFTVELKLFPPHDTDKADEEGSGGLNSDPERVLVAGEQIPAELCISWSREWALLPSGQQYPLSPLSSSPAPTAPTTTVSMEAPRPLEFTYHLTQPPPPPPPTPGIGAIAPQSPLVAGSDTWLIAGRRRGGLSIPSSVPSSGSTFTSESGNNDGVGGGGEGRGSTSFPLLLIPLRTGPIPLPGVEIKAVVDPRMVSAQANMQAGGIGMTTPVVETDYVNSGEVVVVGRDVRSVTIAIGGGGGAGTGLGIGAGVEAGG